MARHRHHRAAQHPSYHGVCKQRCGQRVLVLRNNHTDKFAAIDWYPEPGGNISVSLPARSYRVVPPEELPLLDPTLHDPDAHPTLHVMHVVNCPAAVRARAAKAEQGILPLGAAATATVRRPGRPRCIECDQKLSLADLAAGLVACTTCPQPAKEN